SFCESVLRNRACSAGEESTGRSATCSAGAIRIRPGFWRPDAVGNSIGKLAFGKQTCSCSRVHHATQNCSSTPPVPLRVTAVAKANQVLFLICTTVTAELKMMDLQVLVRSTVLARP